MCTQQQNNRQQYICCGVPEKLGDIYARVLASHVLTIACILQIFCSRNIKQYIL
jgi:hypothetical protein